MKNVENCTYEKLIADQMAFNDTKLRNNIKDAIVKQLKDKSIDTFIHYKNLVDDYMELWDIKNMLQADVKVRGVVCKYNNGGGQEGYKRNESVSELLKVNKQMLTILYDLGIRASDIKVVEEDGGL